ncbi:hypothetical protein [Clostridium perfringens]|uniref:hypothetical protein n=1 Tax=Clostridium perfringens TaxID=1502 RepID=UPI0024BC5DFF|nr:hypothetical protein [Clostridium perfringens]
MNNITFSDFLLSNKEYIETRDKLTKIIKDMHNNDVFVGSNEQQEEYRDFTDIHNSITLDLLENYTKKYCN